MTTTREMCASQDAADPVAHLRDGFDPPAPGWIFMDANSIGAMPRALPARMDEVLRAEWSATRRRGLFDAGWVELPLTLGRKLAPVIGAEPDSVAVCDTTSVNVFKLVAAALDMRPTRAKIVTEAGNFPTDVYMAEGLARLYPGRRLVLAEDDAALHAAIDDDTAAVLLSHVDYRTSRRHDMAAINRIAAAAGALTIWDLSHAAGAHAVALDASGADFALGCTYKYLCGGPGAPAYVYVAPRHQNAFMPVLAGWQGHAERFKFQTSYAPAAGIRRNLVGSPHVLSAIGLECALAVWAEADLDAAFAKGEALRDLFAALVEERCDSESVRVVSPRPASTAGGHIAVEVADAEALCARLMEDRLQCSSRKPNYLRFGISPLYTRHVDIWDAVERLAAATR